MGRRIDVLGAGVSGLATAFFLSRMDLDAEIHVWERESAPGGLASCFATEHFTVERFYHHIFRRDRALQALIAEVGLGDDLVWRPAGTGAYYFNRPYRLSSPLDLLRFRPLPLLDRIRLGLLVLRARAVRDWHDLDDVSAADYIRRSCGERVYRVVWEPLLHGKFGGHAERVSAAWLWSKLVDRGGSRDAAGREVLGYLRGGLSRLFERMVEELERRGHHVHLGRPVTAIRGDGRVEAIVADDREIRADVVVSGLQTAVLVELLPASDDGYRERLARINFLGNVCLVLLLRRSLSEFYWTNVTDPDAPFVGIIEHTKWADAADFAGRHVAYISAYVGQDDERLHMDADGLLDLYLPWVRKMFPDFDPAMVVERHVWRARHAQPIVHVGYRRLVPDIHTPLDNLYLCTMAQIYPNDRQVSNGVDMAERTATRIRQDLTRGAS